MGGLRRSVADLRNSIEFYCGALGFHLMDCAGAEALPTRARLALGNEHIDLVEVEAAAIAPPAAPNQPRFQHAALVTTDMDAAWRRLCRFRPAAISDGGAPQRLPASAGGVTAFKFRDPDGHPLELLMFPGGEGGAEGGARRGRGLAAMPGIDHFAFVVADVERSIAFFAALGFRVLARQINRGVEQERLDGFAGAVVEVVALAGADADMPHLELLGYRAPQSAARALRHGQESGVRPDTIWLGNSAAEDRDQGTIVDPDGHVFIVAGPARFEHRADHF